jgi:hypothetical protein
MASSPELAGTPCGLAGKPPLIATTTPLLLVGPVRSTPEASQVDDAHEMPRSAEVSATSSGLPGVPLDSATSTPSALPDAPET